VSTGYGRHGFPIFDSALGSAYGLPSWQGTLQEDWTLFPAGFLGVGSMGKTQFALAVVAALSLGSLCTTGSKAATALRSPDALPVAAASVGLADQVAMVCRTKRVCGPGGHCRTERYCERRPGRWGGPGSGTGTGGGEAGRY
jgi:hypothetical protein